MASCEHLNAVQPRELPGGDRVCEDCVKTGDSWVHLRMCMECGHVGCCDSSKNRHARRHVESSGHQVVRSAEPGENWAYCFADDVAVRLS